MNILMPMAGAGSRFVEEGYKNSKPAISISDRRSGEKIPMVVAATLDLPIEKATKIIYIDRDFHQSDGTQDLIKSYIPKASFITIDYLTEGQASTCLIAKQQINNKEELLIAGCDNGMTFNHKKFEELKTQADCIVFTYRQHDLVLEKPNAHGWVKVNEQNQATSMSVKKAISNFPLNDHAVVATFWFKQGKQFISAAEKMIQENDRINGEFYVDQVIQHVIQSGLKVKVFEIDKYLCWGTPKDFEEYEATLVYWNQFVKNEPSLKLVSNVNL